MRPRPPAMACLVSCIVAVAAATAPATAEADAARPAMRGYGLLKLDVSCDSSPTLPGAFVKWAEPESAAEGGGCHMSANPSRLGLEIADRDRGRFARSARIEVDFFGAGRGDRPQPRIRHAYVLASWPGGFELLAGQTSDLISPLNPATLNYTVAWWAGNIGFRRPQVRLTKSMPWSEVGEVTLAAALTGSLGDAARQWTGGGRGEDARRRGIQARVGLARGRPGGHVGAVGISAHWGREELVARRLQEGREFETWSLNLDGAHTLGNRVEIRGELFTGANLDAYLGGAGQGVSAGDGRVIASRGGWLELRYSPLETLDLYLGASRDDVDGESPAAGRAFNGSLYSTAIYSLNDNLRVGVEVSLWTTEHRSTGVSEALRAQLSLLRPF